MFPAQTTRKKFENSVFKTFSVHAKKQIPPVSRVFSKCSLILTDLEVCGGQGQTVERSLRFESYNQSYVDDTKNVSYFCFSLLYETVRDF